MVRFWIAACVSASALVLAGCFPAPGDAVGSGDAPPPDRAGPGAGERSAHDPPPAPQKQAGLFFPRLPGPEEMSPSAMGGGKLVVKNRCIHMAPDGGGGVVVWPHGYSLRREGGEVLVLDGRGDVVAKVGGEVRLGGGQITQEEAGPTPGAARRAFEKKREELGVPGQCWGPLWVSSGVVG